MADGAAANTFIHSASPEKEIGPESRFESDGHDGPSHGGHQGANGRDTLLSFFLDVLCLS